MGGVARDQPEIPDVDRRSTSLAARGHIVDAAAFHQRRKIAGLQRRIAENNPDHPITKGVRDFVVTDEQRFTTYDKDAKYVLARSVNEDGLDYTDTLAGAATRPRPRGLTTTAKGESASSVPDT